MVDAFATVEDLQTRLGRTFDEDRIPQIDALLADASTTLRTVIGQQVYPQSTVTFQAWPSSGRVYFPMKPVVNVSAVTRDGVAADWVEGPDFITVRGCGPVLVTLTYGYAEPPDELVRWCCVLVSQTLTTLELNLGLSVGGLSSVAIDDFRAAFADGGDSTGMELSEANKDLLRERFGSLAAVGGF